MKTLSLKLDETVFSDTEQVLQHVKNPETGISMKLWNITIESRRENYLQQNWKKNLNLLRMNPL